MTKQAGDALTLISHKADKEISRKPNFLFKKIPKGIWQKNAGRRITGKDMHK